jgi:3-deoxy-D-manno-octulosonate 8-phosphate phosphatase (KDO 8-P phosphatase)
MDCDGVLTDGRLYFSAKGEAMKAFDVRDGQGIALWHAAGFDSGIISGRDSGGIVAARANELGIKYVREGSADKVADFRAIIDDAGVSPEETAFIGDDIGDIELLKLVGFSVAVADAVDAVKEVAHHSTKNSGGRGAVRELIDLILESKRN